MTKQTFLPTGKAFTALGEWQPEQASIMAAGLKAVIEHMENRSDAGVREVTADIKAFLGALQGGHDARWFNEKA